MKLSLFYELALPRPWEPEDEVRLVGQAMGGIGTPEQIPAWLRRYEDAGVDEMLFIVQHGRTRHEDIMESIRLDGHDVPIAAAHFPDLRWGRVQRLDDGRRAWRVAGIS